MKVVEAKNQVLPLIFSDAKFFGLETYLDPQTPDGDQGKIMIAGEPARIIHPRDGFYAKVNLDWFEGSTEMPKVRNGKFFWYVFALAEGRKGITSYFICDYTQLRFWTLEFNEPTLNEHLTHSYWRGEIKIIDRQNKQGYFRWGDESPEEKIQSRFINLRNFDQIIDPIVHQSYETVKESNLPYDVNLLPDESNPLKEIRQFRETYQNLRETERESIVQSRIGQGIFRDKLMSYWEACSITNCEDFSLLRASHIKPWRVSNNEERLDVFNGLLLIPNLDLAFDKGLITFNEKGKIIISNRLSPQTCETLGIKSSMRLKKIEENHLPYLAFHREKIFKA